MCCLCKSSYKPRDVQIYLLGNSFGLSSSCLWWLHHAVIGADVRGEEAGVSQLQCQLELTDQVKVYVLGKMVEKKVDHEFSGRYTQILFSSLIPFLRVDEAEIVI